MHGKNVITDITLNDGEWHFICCTWSSNGKFDIYIDGSLRDSGNNLSTNMLIEANGTVIVGQEQVNKMTQHSIRMFEKFPQFKKYHFRIALGVALVIQNRSLVASLTWMFGVDESVAKKCSNFIQHVNHIKAIYLHGRTLNLKSMEQ